MLTIPEEYGGLNASSIVQMMFNDVTGYYKAQGIDILGVKMIGPVIHAMGSEEQKREHFEPIAKVELFWGQGLSEPDAGSDYTRNAPSGQSHQFRDHLRDEPFQALQGTGHQPENGKDLH